jgi:hypothetical protein
LASSPSPLQTTEPVTTPAPDPGDNQRSGLDLWMHRISVLLFVLLCAGAGVTLAVLPWMLQWDDNYLLLRIPALRPIVSHGFVRGVCSGLGILDLWIGFSEASNYHEDKPPQK